MGRPGRITGINGNMVSVEFDGNVKQNEVAYIISGEKRLKSEVVRIKGNGADLQVFESTRGLMVGDEVSFSGDLLSVELGPGLLGRLFDGLQNPLHRLAERYGVFLEAGKSLPALPRETKWPFTPKVKAGDSLSGGDTIGTVKEFILEHRVMVPFGMTGRYEVVEISGKGDYSVEEKVALVRDERGELFPLKMFFSWPVKWPVTCYRERLAPSEPLTTRIRIVDTLFPVGRGGTFCIPGPFGAGKTVLQQITSRNAMVDVVIIAACGERAGEVVETIQEFPKIEDPFTGGFLMDRTIIVCNTSSMPIAARESSVYTAVTMAEYYRQMGLDVLLLADSTSRWAQAMRERSGRLEEIPGEEAFPAYLESVIADFYERAGVVRLTDGSTGSVTIGGTISPAGGYFEEPVTQATLKVVGAFHALSRERSDARRFPAIEPLQSWSKYSGTIEEKRRKMLIKFLAKADEISQMMKVIGEEGTPLGDYIIFLKGEFFDYVYLQQNAFDEVDKATTAKRQKLVFALAYEVLITTFKIRDRDEARDLLHKLRQLFLDLNGFKMDTEEFSEMETEIKSVIASYREEAAVKDMARLTQAFVETDRDPRIWAPERRKRVMKSRLKKMKQEIEEEKKDEEGTQ